MGKINDLVGLIFALELSNKVNTTHISNEIVDTVLYITKVVTTQEFNH